MALDSVLQNVANSRSSKLVFDLDSTLFNLDDRNIAIFRDCAEQLKGLYTQESEALSNIQPEQLFYDLKLSLKLIGIQNPAFEEQVMQLWSERFFSNDYLKFDSPEPGAREFILEAQKHGAEVIYLTGRDEPRMFQGTVNSLSEHGFLDLYKRPRLILKPHKDITDHDFKVQALEPIASQADYSCLIDNEPMNLKLTETRFPQIDLVYFDSIHTGLTEPELYWKKVSCFTHWKPVKAFNRVSALSLDT